MRWETTFWVLRSSIFFKDKAENSDTDVFCEMDLRMNFDSESMTFHNRADTIGRGSFEWNRAFTSVNLGNKLGI